MRKTVPTAVQTDRRLSAPWKVRLAAAMRASTDASNGWLAQHLQMGSAAYLSKHVGLLRQQGER